LLAVVAGRSNDVSTQMDVICSGPCYATGCVWQHIVADTCPLTTAEGGL